MGILSFLNRNKTIELDAEQKTNANGGETWTPKSFVGFLQDSGDYDLSFAMLLRYYDKCAPFSDAVNIVADAFAEITPVVREKATKKIVKHDILKLLQYPSNSMSQTDFMRHFCSMYLITGNPLLKAIGNINRPPIELDVTNPTYSQIEPDRVGDMDRILINSEFESSVYKAFPVEGRSRFRANDDLELWPAFTFNPRRGSRIFYGAPIGGSLYNDIEQYINAGVHNKSLLKNGARPGGTFTSVGDTMLTDKQFTRMENQIDAYYVGANNAGRPLFMENVTYTEHSISNKDMDYKTMNENSRGAIYRQYRIPMPIVESKTMTHSNFESAQVALYDRAVLPITRALYEQLTVALMYRYGKDWRKYEIGYEESEIPALQLRRSENIKLKSSTNVHTVDEIRADFGDEPFPDGKGDVLLRNANEIPALEGTKTTPTTPPEGQSEEEQEKFLRAAVGTDGNSRYTEQDIDRILGR